MYPYQNMHNNQNAVKYRAVMWWPGPCLLTTHGMETTWSLVVSALWLLLANMSYL